MTITAADIPIPTTASLNASPQRLPSREEQRRSRAQQARHQTAACPHCGDWAIVETVTSHRAGMPGVVQTISRCQRQPRWRGERCPLTILHEEWAPDQPDDQDDDHAQAESLREPLREALRDERPQAKAGAEEESMPERTCATCGVDISERGVRAKWCETCAAERKRQRDQEHSLRLSAQRKAARGAESVQAPAPQPQAIETAAPLQNVHPPVPQALRVSVLTIAQQATDNAGTRALLRDALALSPERQDLLRRLLDDVEAA